MKKYKVYMRNAQGEHLVGWDNITRLSFTNGDLKGFYTYRIKKYGLFTEYFASWEQTKWWCDRLDSEEQEVFI